MIHALGVMRPLLLLVALAAAALLALAIMRQHRRRMAQQALHDTLTGLPRRELFKGRLEVALARGRRRGYTVAVLFVDLDRFEAINESLGYQNGDRLLLAVMERMAATLREEDTLARLGDDEFTILFEEVAGPLGAAKAAQRVLRLFDEPFQVNGHPAFIGASIGVSVSSDGHGSAEDLLRDAALARQQAKGRGRGRYEIFEPRMREEVSSRLAMERELRQAVDGNQLELVYQPEVRLDTGQVIGLEALLRWHHPTRGLLGPDVFIPLAEETGVISGMGRWALWEACRLAVRMGDEHRLTREFQVSVNVSARQLETTGRLVADVSEVLESTGLAPEVLRLEITESALMEHLESAVAAVTTLREMGVGVAIDDFGTGYSSLSYLKHFPVSTLKLDKSFVQGLQDPVDSAIVRSVVKLGGSLGVAVTAEGIESQEQLSRVLELGCLVGQGYYLSSPLPEQAVPTLLDGCRWDMGTSNVAARASVNPG